VPAPDQIILDRRGKPEHVFHRERIHPVRLRLNRRLFHLEHDPAVAPQRDLMSTPLNRKTALIAVFTERYVLSLVYLYLTWIEFQKPWLGLDGSPATDGAVLVETSRHINRLLLFFFTALLLLLARRAVVPPQQLKGILIPLITTFFNVLYGVVSYLPVSLQKSLWPSGWQIPPAIAGFILVVMGPVFALWGILYLGRSFGIFVEVRKVVFDGPYRWVRHPMYLGWICMYAGVALANGAAAYLILVPIHIGLLLYRARLEEAQLSEFSAEYRKHMQRAGFIFPRFRQAAGASND
jgi:protein-S-isoprenylcysteine O-methyltransferase Ste14